MKEFTEFSDNNIVKEIVIEASLTGCKSYLRRGR